VFQDEKMKTISYSIAAQNKMNRPYCPTTK
jgi:hypothetical protein